MLDWIRDAMGGGAAAAARLIKRGNEELARGELDRAAQSYGAAVARHASAEGYVNLGYVLKELGQADGARQALEQALGQDPAQFDAAYLLGSLALEGGDGARAVAQLTRALELQPGADMAMLDLCAAKVLAGDVAGARRAAQEGIAAHPDRSEFHFLLGNIQAGTAEPEEALASYARALALQPGHPETHHNAGLALQGLGRTEEAIASFRKALALRPDYGHALCALASVLTDQGALEEAAALCHRALAAEPGLAEAHNNLGNVLLAQGDYEKAIEQYRAAIALQEGHAQAHNNLGLALLALERGEEAVQAIGRALALKPDYARGHNNLGNALQRTGRLDEAIASYERALALEPTFAKAHHNFAVALNMQGRHALAMQRWRQALALDPHYMDAWTGLLFLLSFSPDCTPAQYLEEARGFGRVCASLATPFEDWAIPLAPLPSGQPLRVGLVSGDMRSHPVGFFLEGVIPHLDPARIALHAYSTNPVEDRLTARIKPRFASWQLLLGRSDADAAARIRADGIHVLIDLAGMTDHNRLPMFSWRPAPVQATWLGFFASTGVPGVDFLIADPTGVPAGREGNFSETIRYLPQTRLCFSAPEGMDHLVPNALPALSAGHLTFGCYQNLTKINDDVLAAWGRVFAALPDARLRHQSKQMSEPSMRALLLERLARHGVAPERVELAPASGREAYFAAHHAVDVMLDTFPYGGGTTTCEALWMGVPTITLAGETLLARQGASLLTSAGLADWVAEDADAYVRILLRHCADLPALAALRAGLRAQVLASPLYDGRRFAAHLQDLLESMWLERAGGARPPALRAAG